MNKNYRITQKIGAHMKLEVPVCDENHNISFERLVFEKNKRKSQKRRKLSKTVQRLSKFRNYFSAKKNRLWPLKQRKSFNLVSRLNTT